VCDVRNNYSVVSHVAGGGAQVDDGSGGGAAVSEGVDVSHDVVSEFTFLLGRHGEVDVLFVALHLHNLGVGDGQTQRLRRRRRVMKNKIRLYLSRRKLLCQTYTNTITTAA